MAIGCSLSDVADMPSSHYQRWVRYYNTEPFGHPREERRWGNLISSVLRASPNKWSSTKEQKPDFWIFSKPKPIDYEQVVSAYKVMSGNNVVRRRRSGGN